MKSISSNKSTEDLDQATYVSDIQLAKRFSVSRQTVWRWSTHSSNFPKPVKLSHGCTRWNLKDIEFWEASR